MILPYFEYLSPDSLDQALALKAQWGERAAWLAGGTDLLVRAKQGLASPQALISLKGLTPHLSGLSQEGQTVTIGAQTPLADLAAEPLVARHWPGLRQALDSIGAPTLQQRVGTIGGNLCAATRCLYYNQSALWRAGLAPCFKLGGEVCHAGGESVDRCRSVCCSDAAVMLMALGARVVLASAEGQRTLGLEDFFTGKGEEPLALEPGELLSQVRLELGPGRAGSAYVKLAARGALDFPQLSAAASLVLEGGKLSRVKLALGAVFAAPLLLKDAMAPLMGQEPTPELLAQAARRAGSHAEPFIIENQSMPAAWRREMAAVAAGRALQEAWQRAEGADG